MSRNPPAPISQQPTHHEIPAELNSLLIDFTVSVLVNRPTDLVDYAAGYFRRLNEERRTSAHSGLSNHLGDDDPDSTSSDIKPPARLSFTRRKSVFAEQYDPEEDEDEGDQIVHPKSDIQRQRLSEAIKNILLFRSLEPMEMGEVIDAMFERKVDENEIVIRQGDDGDNFYVISDGTFSIVVENDGDGTEREVGKYTGSGSFGELALMYNMPRAATVRAITSGSLWAMNRQTFRKIVLKRAFQKRKEYETFIESMEILKCLDYYERMSLSDALVPKFFNQGDCIIKQGEDADGMYFVQDGEVQIYKVDENSGAEKEVSHLGKGGYFGELALITKNPRAASVYAATENVKCAFLDVSAFERLLGPCVNIMKRNDYQNQMSKLFGSKSNVTDLR